MTKVTKKWNEREDNIICTFVKLYSFNISFGITRASEYLGLRRSLVLYRYYKHLRNERQIFGVKFGDKTIWNTRTVKKEHLDEIKKYEKLDIKDKFRKIDKREWWKKEEDE